MADPNAHPHLQSHHCNRVRRGQWCALTSFSILALVAIRIARLDENGTPMPSEAKVVEPTIVVVLVMSAFSAIAHVALTDMFVGSIAEGVLVRQLFYSTVRHTK